MVRKLLYFVFGITLLFFDAKAQGFSRKLLKADKYFIRQAYTKAIPWYEKYLKKHPRDYYASRQTAVCYARLNNPGMAIDYWPAVIENAEANERDLLDYSRCLLANYRKEEAARVLVMLKRSKDPLVAAWARAYANPAQFFKDSALVKVTEVTGINTPAHEFGPLLQGGRLFYFSDPLKSMRLFSALSDEKLLQIHAAAQRDSTGFYADVAFNDFKARNLNGQFCFSADGASIWFAMAVYSKEMGIATRYPFFRFQLFTANSSGPTDIRPFQHNRPGFDYLHPCLSKDGKHLYFASDGPGTMGGKDIFVCHRLGNEWTAPQALGAEVNSVGDEVFPHLGEDGTLYFSSSGLPGLGGLDLFFARPRADGAFEKAVNAGAYLNSQFDDFGIYVLPGGKTGYFSSNRKDNSNDDIYYFRDARY